MLADEIFRGELTVPSSLNGAAQGVDAVLSSAGITRQREGFRYDQVDYQGNLNLLQIAETEGANSFLYVSLFRGQELQYLRIAAAKERFVARLRASKLSHCVIRPTAFFSDIGEVFALARKGIGFVFGKGAARINPISGRDLAEASVEALLSGQHELEIGGPQIFTHQEIATLAFTALQKPARIWHLPLWTAKAASRVLRSLAPVQVYGPVEFFLAVATQDMVASRYGHDQLTDFFRELASCHTTAF